MSDEAHATPDPAPHSLKESKPMTMLNVHRQRQQDVADILAELVQVAVTVTGDGDHHRFLARPPGDIVLDAVGSYWSTHNSILVPARRRP